MKDYVLIVEKRIIQLFVDNDTATAAEQSYQSAVDSAELTSISNSSSYSSISSQLAFCFLFAPLSWFSWHLLQPFSAISSGK